MAKQNKRYFWLKLYDDFFTSKRIKRLRQVAGGDTYTIIYLKMQLKALKQDGYLYYDGVLNDFAEELALDLDESPDNVRMTIDYLIKVGLLEMSSDGMEYYLTYLKNCIGSETASTQRSRECRLRKKEQKALQCNTDATPLQQNLLQCNTNATPLQHLCNVEKEKEKEKEINISNTDVLDISSDNENVSDPEPYEESIENTTKQFVVIAEQWNQLEKFGITPVRIIGPNTERGRMLRARIRQYGFESFKEIVEQISQSEFLQGKNERGWQVTFDWVVHPSNYSKVLEGNYKTSRKIQQQAINRQARNFVDLGNRFNDFEQNNYDFNELELKLLDN